MGKAVASGSRSGLECESGMEENVKLQPGGFSEGEFPSERS
jgi:hypothetical protein